MQFKLESFTKKCNYTRSASKLLQTTRMGDGAIAQAIGCSLKTVRRAKKELRMQGVLPMYDKPIRRSPDVNTKVFNTAMKAFRISDDQERRQHNEENQDD